MMQSLSALLERLTEAGIQISADQDKLLVQGPAHALDAGLRDALREHKHALLAHLAGHEAAQATATVQIYPLNAEQTRLWFMDKLSQNSQGFVLQASFLLRGRLDPAVWQAALRRTLERHAILSARLEEDEKQAWLRLAEHPPGLELCAADTSHVLPPGVLFRALLQPQGADHRLTFLIHHLIADRSSMAILINDCFAAVLGDELPPAPQFTEHLLGTADTPANTPAALSWWQATLAGAPAELALPFDWPRPTERSHQGAMISRPLGAGADLGALSRRLDATPFMVYLALYAQLLQRWSGEDDMVIGCPVSTRTRPEDRRMLGFMVNTLPLRLQPALVDTLEVRVQQVRQTLLDALSQPPVTLDQIVGTLKPRRHLNRNPLFQVMFVLQAEPLALPALPGLEIESLPVAALAPEVDLNLSLERSPDPAQPYIAHLEYDPTLFSADTADAFLQQFIALCEAAAQPRAPGADQNGNTLLACRQGPRVDLPATTVDTLISEALRHQAGERILLQDAGGALSCAQLQAHSAGIARALLDQGLGSASRIGLCLPRLTELVPALLATWRIGACAVFLPTDGPARAIAERTGQAELALLLTGTDSPALAGLAGIDCPCLGVTTLQSGSTSAEPYPPTSASLPHQPAYVCFTSGTSGQPKAVFISHASLLNHALDVQQRFQLTPADRVLQFAAPAFDVLLEEVIPALISGAQLVQLAPRQSQDFQAFSAALQQHAISVANLPAAFWHAWTQELSAAGENAPAPLRLLITGSEAVNATVARNWRRHAPNCRLLCAYGLTESTITASFLQADDIPAHWSVMPLGHPIQNVEIAIVGQDGQILPPLCVGEIRLRGQALMLRSSADSTGVTTHQALDVLHTGDRGRMGLDGSLWCLGRQDRQVKIRGIRVEPASLEHALSQLPGVGEAAALTLGQGQRQHLWAFVSGQAQLSAATLKAALHSRLPEVLIPERILVLPALPRTAQGKTDYRALGAIAAEQAPDSPAGTLDNDREQLLASIFSEVLQRSPIGPEDNFFDLGGDSISSLQVIARARRAGLNLSARLIYEHQTVRAIAGQADSSACATLDTGEATGALWATPILAWFKTEMKGTWQHFNQAVVIALPTPLRVPDLHQALAAVVQCHEIFGLQVLRSPAGQVAYHIPAQRPAPLFEVLERPAALDDAGWAGLRAQQLAAVQRRLDPLTGLNVAALVLPDDGQMLLTVHHLCIDVLSWQVVLRDLQTAYESPASPLRRHGPPYRRWAAALHEFSLDPSVRAALRYWTEALAPQPDTLAPDLPPRPGLEADARTLQGVLSAELTQRLLRKGSAALGLRMDEILVTALALAHAAQGGRRLRIDLERNGRASPLDELDISETVGWFTSVIPLCLETDADVRQMARKVKSILAQHPHDGLSYGLLRYGDDPDAALALAGLPPADALINYVGVLEGWTQAPFQPLDADPGPTIAADLARSHRIELNAGVVAGRLRLALNHAAGPDSAQAAAALMSGIEQALGQIGAAVGDEPPADHAASTAPGMPLTPLQRGILLHSLHDPQTYFDQLLFRLDGPLDVAALRTAWSRLIERHAALRCSFGFDDRDEACQQIHDSAALSWQFYDWTAVDDSLAHRDLQALMQADQARGFALEQAPLMRMHLIRRAADRHDWVWSSHHLILDGWSVSILMQEWLKHYEACLQDTDPQLAPAPDWQDFVSRWQARDSATARRWWQQALAAVSPTLIAPAAPDTRATQTRKTRQEAGIALDAATREGLAALCRQHAVPPGVVMQASWALLLRRYRSVETAVFGITFAHRPADFDKADALVGMTINTVPVIARMQSEMPLAALLDTLREQAFERADHAFIGLDDILQAGGHDSSGALFDTLLLVQNYPRPSALAASGLSVTLVEVEEQTNFSLTAVVTSGDTAALSLIWDGSRIPAALGEAILGHWHQLLQAMIAAPQAPLRALSLYTETGLAERLALAQGPHPALPAPGALQRLEQWAEVIPEHPALHARDGQYSYRALADAAASLCDQLLAQGLRSGEVVAIVLPRGARAVTALLAVMKAGAVAMPIDAGYPAERVAFMLQDSQARWLITCAGLMGNLPPPQAVTVLLLDQMPAYRQPLSHRPPPLAPDSPAYLIYTSGSTGQPKGALNSHRGLASMMRLQQFHLAPEAADRVLQFASLSFDASIWEIFMALGSGATLHIPDPDAVRFGEELLDYLEQSRISIATLPPSLMLVLPARPLPALRLLMVAGEACPAAVADKWSRGRRFFNGYGPSEAAVCSNLHEVSGQHDIVPIGRPAACTRSYVLDPDEQLVPPGGEGELLIGGEGVGLGYLHQAALSAQRFGPDPWDTGGTGKVYRSGDRVRLSATGELSFVGRIDRQLKVRGFRVEPGEIERQLEQLAPLDKALVGLSPRSGGEPLLLGWVLPASGQNIDTDHLRAELGRRLPAHMVPAVLQTISRIPLTANGKIDWAALPLPTDTGADADECAPPASTGHARPDPLDRVSLIARSLEPIWAGLLGLRAVAWQRNFFDLGGQSLLLVKMQPMLRKTFNIRVPTRILFEHLTIQALAQWLAGQDIQMPAGDQDGTPHTPPPAPGAQPEAAPRPPVAEDSGGMPDPAAIAIVGMACRFPGADSVAAFWELLRNGQEGITTFAPHGTGTATGPHTPHYVPRRGVIADCEHFDAGFFGIGARDAVLLDPQHRLFLEGAWNAFEDAGEVPGGNVGVFAGCSHNTWLREVLQPAGEDLRGSAGFHAITANDKDFLATQVAFRLNLGGPAVTVQSACSTSLVAVSLAVDALRAGRCEMALAGGVALSFPEQHGYPHENGMILSPDGHCRAFSAHAAGTVPGAGMGIVLLKPLAKALEDGNHIYAIVRGAGLGNDGARKMSFAAPGVEGQTRAIQEALADAGLEGHEVDIIEAHGTGTALGDPVEISALGRAYARREHPLLIGSVKSNIGHADSAAGIAGLIKATLSLHHRFLPASLHASPLNPKLAPDTQRWFDIAVQGRALTPPGRPLRAGISSFGIGGTNAHVIIEEAPARRPADNSPGDWQLIPLSATSTGQLARLVRALQHHLSGLAPAPALCDLATTLQRGRAALKCRRAWVADSTADLLSHLAAPHPEVDSKPAPTRIAFLLPGQGAQHPLMAQALLDAYPSVREHLSRLSAPLLPILGQPLIDALQDKTLGDTYWQDTRIAQPVIVALSLACASWWASLGIRFDCLLGHSLGEYTAACLAGVFSEEEALTIVSERARLMAAMPPGAMLAVALDEATLAERLQAHPALDLAAINGPRQTVVSGPQEAVDRLASELAAQAVPVQRLHTSHAFHSRSMAPAAEAFEAFLHTRELKRPERKFISNLSGSWISAEQANSPGYWAAHMLAPVRFAQGLQTLSEKGITVGIEAGPGQVLSLLARRQGLNIHPSLAPSPTTDHADTTRTAPAHLLSVARLWEAGVNIDWTALNPQPGRRLPLPTYPWARKPFRPERNTAPTPQPAPAAVPISVPTPAASQPDNGLQATIPGKPPIEPRFYAPLWVRQDLAAASAPAAPLVLYCEHPALARPLALALRQSGLAVRTATSAAAVHAALPPTNGHLLILSVPPDAPSARTAIAALQTTLMTVREALLARHPAQCSVDLITINGATMQGGDTACPTGSALIAALRVLAHEFPEHRFAGLDLVASDPITQAQQIQGWLGQHRAGHFLACRQGAYWCEQVTPIQPPPAHPWPLGDNPTVLITGAAGGVGQAFALDIAGSCSGAHLLLTTHRTPLPDKLLQQLQSLGARISPLAVDLSDEQTASAALIDWQDKHGPITAVIHAAGVADLGGILARRDAGSLHPVLAPKIAGLHAIEAALAGQPLHFMVLCSSLGSFLPAAKFGQIAYSAANAYLDTAAAGLAQRHPWRVITINWDDWAEAGMTVAARARAGLPPLDTACGLGQDQGPAALRRLLPTALNRAVIAINDLPALMARTATWLPTELTAPGAPPPHGPSAAPVPDTGPDLAHTVRDLFREVLNVPGCTLEDNFFDLGGHSLLAMQLIRRLRERTGLDTSLMDLFSTPTPASLAQHLSQARTERA